MTGSGRRPLNVLIVGGGIAGVEAMLALRELAGELVRVSLLSPSRDLVLRPLQLRDPLETRPVQTYSLQQIADDCAAEFICDSFRWLDPPERVAHTSAGAALEYDALLLCQGARMQSAFSHAVTIDDRRLGSQVWDLVRGIDAGSIRSLAFLAHASPSWPVPLYELALLAARRGRASGHPLSISIVTPEDAPLALFGSAASAAVADVLREHGIVTLSSAHAAVPRPGVVIAHPGNRTLMVDRVMALPRLFGAAMPGVPGVGRRGFIPVDPFCQVRGRTNTFAAGDGTDFPVKHGGVAAQQADVAAAAIAEAAGAAIDVAPFHPEIEAVLWGGQQALRLSAQITGGHGDTSEVTVLGAVSPQGKVSARYLTPYLEAWGQPSALRR